MEIGKTLYLTKRSEWRKWLSIHRKTETEIWLIYYKKNSDKPRISYNDAVEEALCFGWIDSILKPINKDCYVQRFSPRRKNSPLSEMNKERVRRLIKAKKMTKYGMEMIKHHLDAKTNKIVYKRKLNNFKLPDDILKELKTDSVVWKNFKKFSDSYKRIRIGWIDASRNRPEFFRTRLNYFIRMTAKNKKFGMVQ